MLLAKNCHNFQYSLFVLTYFNESVASFSQCSCKPTNASESCGVGGVHPFSTIYIFVNA